MAATTLMSSPVSLTLNPPAKFRKTSFWYIFSPTLFSSTASSMFRRRESNPVAERWGVP